MPRKSKKEWNSREVIRKADLALDDLATILTVHCGSCLDARQRRAANNAMTALARAIGGYEGAISVLEDLENAR